MPRQDNSRNQRHLDKPVPGDYWVKHLVLTHVVLHLLPNGNLVIAPKDPNVRLFQRPQLDAAYEITPSDHRRLVQYTNHEGFVAEVVCGSQNGYHWLVEWAVTWDSAYTPIA